MPESPAPRPLEGVRVLSLAGNVPGPVAASRLTSLGAAVTKVEPPRGDPLARSCPAWYESIVRDQEVVRLDLKDPAGRAALDPLLGRSELLLTASRPAALLRLSLDPAALRARFPGLAQVAIVGFPSPEAERAGHDLTFQAAAGLLSPPHLPRTLVADLAAAERAVSAALGLLLGRARGHPPAYAEVSLLDAAESFAPLLRHGLTAPGGLLCGGLAGYDLYPTRQGWIALAALESHFWERLIGALGLEHGTREELESAFSTRTAEEWDSWARALDLPLAMLREAPLDADSQVGGEEEAPPRGPVAEGRW